MHLLPGLVLGRLARNTPIGPVGKLGSWSEASSSEKLNADNTFEAVATDHENARPRHRAMRQGGW